MSSVLNRWLARELLHNWLVITLVLWLVLVAARLSLYLGQAAAGRLPAGVVFGLLGLKSVGFLVFLLPLTFFLALLWMLGRMNRDHESLVLAASGAGSGRLYRAIALPVLVAATLVAALSWYLVPETASRGYQLRAQAESSIEFDALRPGRFHVLRKAGLLFWAERENARSGRLENIFVHQKHGDRPRVLLAAGAEVRRTSGARYLVLSDGHRYDGQPGRADYRRLKFDEYAILLEPGQVAPERKPDALPFRDLWGNPDPRMQAELQRRLARPVSVMVLALIAIPLGRFRPGSGRYYPIWMGILLFTLYFNLLGVAQLRVAQGRMPAWPGLWWVHLVPLVLVFGWQLLPGVRVSRRVGA